MSKAFTKEDDAGEALVVPRAPLPPGVPNYVTPSGLAALRAEQRELEQRRSALAREDVATDRTAQQALAERSAELDGRIASAVLVEPSTQPRAEVRFGARVEVETAAGELRSYRIVGVDEADAGSGLIAFTTPIARALLGKNVGDSAEVRTPRGGDQLTIVTIDYDA